MTIRYSLVLVVFSVLFFARSFSSYFVCDDYQFLGRVNFSNAGTYFTKSWGYGNEYRPLLPYSYALDGRISGDNPLGYHLTSTLLHAANSLLLVALALMVGIPKPTAILASLIYLLNPVTHETVLWIAGRPVVLVSFFMLGCCWSFLRFLQGGRPGVWLTATYVLFLLGLGVYELAIVTPLLAAYLALFANDTRANYKKHLVCLVGLAGLYGLLWNWFFDFRFTRIHIEHSPLEIANNFVQAVAHSFHGSLSLEILPAYLFLLGWLCRSRRGRMLALAALGWFVIAYLPFFAVTGFADRFVYVASAGTAIVLATAIRELTIKSNRTAAAVTLLLLGYFATGMQNRITAWKEAGEIARAIPEEIKRVLPVFPEDREVVILNVPPMHKRSYVYLTSFDRALERKYPGARINFKTSLADSTSGNPIILEYSQGRIVRRTQ